MNAHMFIQKLSSVCFAVFRLNPSLETDLNGNCRKRKYSGDGDGRNPKQRRVSSLQKAKQDLIKAQRGQSSFMLDTTTQFIVLVEFYS